MTSTASTASMTNMPNMPGMPSFKCLQKLGSGAFGKIYACQEPTSEHKFALKKNFVNAYVDFFGCLRELDILKGADQHPYIIRLQKVIRNNDPYVGTAMSPMRGGANKYKADTWHFGFELAVGDMDYCTRQYNINFGQLKLWILHILLGLEYLHDRHIVHRDLKPANLLIVQGPNGALTCKLGDFGAAKQSTVNECLTQKTGTVWYRSIEVAKGHPATAASDVWGFGCIVYQMFTRGVAFQCILDTPASLQRCQNARLKDPHFMSVFDALDVKQFDSAPGPSWKDIRGIITSCLVLEPSKRPTVRGLLDMPCFNSWRNHINDMRKFFNPQPTSSIPVGIAAFRTPTDAKQAVQAMQVKEIGIPNVSIREQVLSKLLDVYVDCSTRKWFRIRMLFMAADLFDRHVSYVMKGGDELPSLADCIFILGVCFYIAVNYHASDTFGDVVGDSFNNIIKFFIPALANYDTLGQAISMAEYLLTTVCPPGSIHRPTILDMTDNKILSTEDQLALLKAYIGTDLSGCTTLGQVLSACMQTKNSPTNSPNNSPRSPQADTSNGNGNGKNNGLISASLIEYKGSYYSDQNVGKF